MSYYNGSSYTFGWEGRRLVSAVKGTNDMSFAYNDEGIRMSKTVNGVVTEYYYQGSILMAEKTNSQIIVYHYDQNGAPVGFMYWDENHARQDWDVYAFEKNIQGDILAVYDAITGVKLVSYKYNAWGICSTTYHNDAESTTAIKNPYKYRGYYYDSDLGLYYLQSRYYDPEICRFINADVPDVITATPTALTDKNLFAYCDNNPVMRVDEDGEFWVELGIMAVGGLVGAVTNAITSAAMQYFVKGEVDVKSVVVAAASGFVSGAIASSPLGLGGQIIAGSIVGGLSYMADTYVTETSTSLDGLLFSMVAGAIGGAIGGKGLDSDYAVSNQIYSTKVVRAYSSIYYSPVDAAHTTARAIITRNQIIWGEVSSAGLKFLLGSAVSNFATALYSNKFKVNFGK